MMRLIFVAIAALIAFSGRGALAQSPLQLGEITTTGIEDGWASFPLVAWNGAPAATMPSGELWITDIKGAFVGSQSLVGELALWLVIDDPVNGIMFPPAGGVRRRILYSFGAEVYSPPSLPVVDSMHYAPNVIDVPAGSHLSLVVNAGPVNLPGGTVSPSMTYFGDVKFWYEPAPAQSAVAVH